MTPLMGTRRDAYEVLRKRATDEAGDSLAEAVAAVLPWWYLENYMDRLATDDGFREALGLAALELPGLGEVGPSEARAVARLVLRALREHPAEVFTWLMFFEVKRLKVYADRVELGSRNHPGHGVDIALIGGESVTVYVYLGDSLEVVGGEVEKRVAHYFGATARMVLNIALEGRKE